MNPSRRLNIFQRGVLQEVFTAHTNSFLFRVGNGVGKKLGVTIPCIVTP